MPTWPIAVLCVLMFVATGADIAGDLITIGKGQVVLTALALACHLGQLVSIVGLWVMRRWAAYLYLGLFALGIILAFTLGGPAQLRMLDLVAMIIVPAIYLSLVLPYWKRMS